MRQDDVNTAQRVAPAETIRRASSARDTELARALFVEYAQWLKVDLCFQGFDQELARLPGAYAGPRGCLLLAGGRDTAFGCIALRPLDPGSGCGCGAAAPHPEIALGHPEIALGEVKRLYVQPARRGEGWGARLAREIVDEASSIHSNG